MSSGSEPGLDLDGVGCDWRERSGKLFVIEGIDGSGKTTQHRLLVDHLRSRGLSVVGTREPSDGPIGWWIRDLLDRRSMDRLLARHDGMAIADSVLGLLFAADRLDHCARKVGPIVSSGRIVVSDRWYLSTLAYQGRRVDRGWLLQVNAPALRPDLTVYLEVRPGFAARRRSAAGRSSEIFDEDRVQGEVAGAYLAAIEELRARGDRIEVVDGERSVAEVHADVVDRVLSVL